MVMGVEVCFSHYQSHNHGVPVFSQSATLFTLDSHIGLRRAVLSASHSQVQLMLHWWSGGIGHLAQYLYGTDNGKAKKPFELYTICILLVGTEGNYLHLFEINSLFLFVVPKGNKLAPLFPFQRHLFFLTLLLSKWKRTVGRKGKPLFFKCLG